MKKGFTLIELLAVIVILAIIALIAVPVVLNIINDAKESSVLRSAEFYLDAVEYTVADAFLYHGGLRDGKYPITEEGNICKTELPCSSENTLKVEVNGEKPTGGYIEIKEGNIDNVEIEISGSVIWNDPSTGKLDYKLAPGLYDKDNNLVASWEELVEEHDFKNLVENGGLHTFDEENFIAIGYAANIINENYSKATKLVIDESVASIGDYAFVGCTSLTSVTIGKGVTSIEFGAFAGSGLTSITIPNSVTSIGENAFYQCTSLTSVTIPASVTSIGAAAFYGCTSLTSITIPNSVTSIEDWTFGECTSLTSITIPNSITSIGGYAFARSGLTSITTSDSVTSIGESAFLDCKSLTSVIIPSSVTSIGSSAFAGCTRLTTINYKGSQTNWDAITKDANWDRNTPSNKVINYNYAG